MNCCTRAAVTRRSTACNSRNRKAVTPLPRWHPHEPRAVDGDASHLIPTAHLFGACTSQPGHPPTTTLSNGQFIMTDSRYVIPPAPQAAIAVAGTDQVFPVGTGNRNCGLWRGRNDV